MSNFLWGVYPYVALTLFFIVPFIRMVFRPYAWSTRSTGLFNNKLLGFASLLFHWGIFLLFLGHAAGLVGGVFGHEPLIEFFYWAGLVGGIMALIGSITALFRRWAVPEVNAMSQSEDFLIHLLIIPILAIGLYQVIIDKIFGLAYTASSWFASVWAFSPQPELMDSASLLTKIHIFLALTFFAYFPFTKLVHLWTFPINFLVRPPQSVRTMKNKYVKKWEFGLRSDKSFLLYSLLFFVISAIIISAFLGVPQHESVAKTDGQVFEGSGLSGYPLYVSQCARCHGINGAGDGLGANSPTFGNLPRDFVTGHYRFISTDNGVASDEDLRFVIKNGLEPSGMPSFGDLSDVQIKSLVAVLNGLWENRPESGNQIDVADVPEMNQQMADEGSELFQTSCSACHGTDGSGNGPAAQSIKDWKDQKVVPANLAHGDLKSSRDVKQLYFRIAAGIPGGKAGWLMPKFSDALSQDQIWAIVTYLNSALLPPVSPRGIGAAK